MKRPSSKIREEIVRLQEQLKQAEMREAERIGRMALRARLDEIEIDEAELLAAFEELAGRFLQKSRKKDRAGRTNGTSTASVAAGQAAGGGGGA